MRDLRFLVFSPNNIPNYCVFVPRSFFFILPNKQIFTNWIKWGESHKTLFGTPNHPLVFKSKANSTKQVKLNKKKQVIGLKMSNYNNANYNNENQFYNPNMNNQNLNNQNLNNQNLNNNNGDGYANEGHPQFSGFYRRYNPIPQTQVPMPAPKFDNPKEATLEFLNLKTAEMFYMKKIYDKVDNFATKDDIFLLFNMLKKEIDSLKGTTITKFE